MGQPANLDRDRRVGGGRQNQSDYIFVILVMHPKRRRIAAISEANRQNGGEDGCYREKLRNFVAWADAGPQNSIFRVFRVPFDYPEHSLQETVFPQTNGIDESRDSEPD